MVLTVKARQRVPKLPAETLRLRDLILAAAADHGVPLEQHTLRVRVGLPVLKLRLFDKILRGCSVRFPGKPGSYDPDVVTVLGSGFRTSKMWPRKRDESFDIPAIVDHLLVLVEQEMSRPTVELLVPAGIPAAASGLHIVHLAAVQVGALSVDSEAETLVEGVAEQKVRDRIEAHLLRGGLTDRDMRALGSAADLYLYTPKKIDFDPFEPINDRIHTVLLIGKAKNGAVERRYVLILDHRGTEIELADPAGEGLTVITPKKLSNAWKLAARRGRSWMGTISGR